MYFDSHAHIASSPKKYKDIREVIQRAIEANVVKTVDASVDIETSRAVLKFSSRYPEFIIPTIGLHPELLIPGSDIYKKKADIDGWIKELRQICSDNKESIGAIGECGLDYYWIDKSEQLAANSLQLSSKKKNEIKKLQVTLFEKQIELANESRLPLVVHSRGAEREVLDEINAKLKAEGCRLKALFHCFTGEKRVAKNVFEAGYHISFNGILTYPNAGNIREIFELGWNRYRDQVLAETDAPYCAPQKIRGQVCEPADVRYVVNKMAEIVSVETSEVAEVTKRNAMEFYNLGK
ncbi:TatD family hydrolase [Candidatus Dojkabacteria bacterium]|nr:TatD family hydrolase [Candidatus Dojkabacteria bacterium]